MSASPFRYVNDPQQCLRNAEPKPCVGCREHRAEFGFVVFSDDYTYAEYDVCALCLSSGRLKPLGLPVNDPDTETLAQNVALRMASASAAEREAWVGERTDEVVYRTPRPAVMNLFVWPAHCCDYMTFHGRVVAADLTALAPNGDGRAFLARSLEPNPYDDPEERAEQIWETGLDGWGAYYLWKCRECEEYLITFTSD